METPSKTSHRILVVDDEPTVCRAIKLLLQFDGHVVQTVLSGEAALVALEPEDFNLVITDFSMEGMKGTQLAAIIKQRWPGRPVIMATAFAPEAIASGQLGGGLDFLLIKPFTLAELREAIASVMSCPVVRPAATAAPASLAAEAKSRPAPLPPPIPPGESSAGLAWA